MRKKSRKRQISSATSADRYQDDASSSSAAIVHKKARRRRRTSPFARGAPRHPQISRRRRRRAATPPNARRRRGALTQRKPRKAVRISKRRVFLATVKCQGSGFDRSRKFVKRDTYQVNCSIQHSEFSLTNVDFSRTMVQLALFPGVIKQYSFGRLCGTMEMLMDILNEHINCNT